MDEQVGGRWHGTMGRISAGFIVLAGWPHHDVPGFYLVCAAYCFSFMDIAVCCHCILPSWYG
eukprot:scaffold80450_cov35-Attheya_sp.AAC.2